jgi:CMP-N-acetylneuraminic acid synthetase
MFWPEYEQSRSNDLPESFHDAGQFYWCNVEKFRVEKKFFSTDSYAMILPAFRAVDVDTPEDWQMAEILYGALKSRTSAQQR